jgi:hypothetical protein
VSCLGGARIEQRLLEIWEEGNAASAMQRADLLLDAVGLRGEEWPHITLGERNRRLLEANTILFGAAVEGVLVSPCCGERIELELSIEHSDEVLTSNVLALDLGGVSVRCRPPSCADLQAIAHVPAENAATALLERCIVEIDHPLPAESTEEAWIALASVLGEALMEHDKWAVIDVRTSCPGCSEEFVEALVPAAFVWQRLDAWAIRLLEEIHLLAYWYGWSQSEILELTPMRRRSYLRLIGAA